MESEERRALRRLRRGLVTFFLAVTCRGACAVHDRWNIGLLVGVVLYLLAVPLVVDAAAELDGLHDPPD